MSTSTCRPKVGRPDRHRSRDAVAHGQSIKSVYVYEAPVRIWHWINALAITVLAVTGYFIRPPAADDTGEASDHF